MSFTELRVKFDNKKNNKRAYFTAYFGSANMYFGQSGDFRSDYAYAQFDNKKQFIAAVNKYLKNPNARIERLELDAQVVLRDTSSNFDVRETILKAALESIKG